MNADIASKFDQLIYVYLCTVLTRAISQSSIDIKKFKEHLSLPTKLQMAENFAENYRGSYTRGHFRHVIHYRRQIGRFSFPNREND